MARKRPERTFTRREALAMSLAGAAQIAAQQPTPIASGWGVQLYTVRDLIARDAASTIAAIAAMGYKELEIIQPTLPVVAPLAQKNNLTIVSAHLDEPTARGDGFQDFLSRAKTSGIRYVVVPWVPPAERPTDRSGFERLADRLNRMGEQAARAGLQLCYHNHAFEFGRDADGTRWLDVLMRAAHAPLVQLELDVFWVAITGAQPVETINQYRGRVALMHLKDKAPDAPAQLRESDVAHSSFRDVGSGALDFSAILSAARGAGAQHFFVEHDWPPDPLQTLRASYQFLAKL